MAVGRLLDLERFRLLPLLVLITFLGLDSKLLGLCCCYPSWSQIWTQVMFLSQPLKCWDYTWLRKVSGEQNLPLPGANLLRVVF